MAIRLLGTDDASPVLPPSVSVTAAKVNVADTGNFYAGTTVEAVLAEIFPLLSSSISINTLTGTAYTIVLTDAGRLVTLGNASATTLTVPPNSSVPFPLGSVINFCQLGAGQVTVVQGSGVVVNSSPTKKLRAQYTAGTLIKYATNTWLLIGDLASV